VFAAVVVAVSFGLAAGEEFTAIVTKAGDGKVTFTKFQFGKKEKAEPMTLTVDAKCKYTKGKFSKEDKKLVIEDYPGGKEGFEKAVKEAAEKKDDKKFFAGGVFATLTTEGEGDKAKVVGIRVGGFGGGIKKKDDKKEDKK